MTKDGEAARLALEHCGCIRVRTDHPGYVELFEAGIATAMPVEGDEDALDFRLIR